MLAGFLDLGVEMKGVGLYRSIFVVTITVNIIFECVQRHQLVRKGTILILTDKQLLVCFVLFSGSVSSLRSVFNNSESAACPHPLRMNLCYILRLILSLKQLLMLLNGPLPLTHTLLCQ